MTIEEAREEIKKLQERQWNTTAEYAKAAADVAYRFLNSNPEIVRKSAEKYLQKFVCIDDIALGDTKIFRTIENG
nr:MAG TPA: copper resistance protein [Caudoviricetes sp.]